MAEQSLVDSVRDALTESIHQMETLAATDGFDPDDADVVKLRNKIATDRSKLTALEEAATQRADLERSSAALARIDTRKRDLERVVNTDTLGEAFIRSRQLTSYDGFGKTGRVDTGMTADILKRAVSLPMKTTDFATAITPPSVYLAPAPLQTPLLDLIPQIVWGYDTVPVWTADRTTDGGADVVAEGDEKPSLELAETPTTVQMALVAVWTQATRQVLEDLPGLRSLIDTVLRNDVLKKFESEAVTAVTSASLPTAQAPSSGGTLSQAIRLGIAKVQTAGWNPNAVIINPDDAAAVDIAAIDSKCCDMDSYWGMRVVPVPGMSAGTAVVGDFTRGAATYERNTGVSIYMTDSHADTFTHNVFTILAEARRKTVITRASAFAKVSVASP